MGQTAPSAILCFQPYAGPLVSNAAQDLAFFLLGRCFMVVNLHEFAAVSVPNDPS